MQVTVRWQETSEREAVITIPDDTPPNEITDEAVARAAQGGGAITRRPQLAGVSWSAPGPHASFGGRMYGGGR